MKTQLENANTIPAVYTAVINVMNDMGAISKGRKNAQQGYMFRGVDDVLNHLQPLLIKHNLVILPEVISRSESERASKSGGTFLQVVVNMKFTLISAIDGSTLVTNYIGESMDSGDKATNKAMSTAYKYFCFQTFCIPTDEPKDSENDTPEIAASPQVKTTAQPTVRTAAPAAPVAHTPVVNDDNKPWLNLRAKDGKLTEQGIDTYGYIQAGGTISELAKKYKISKAVRAELEAIPAATAATSEPDFDAFGNYDVV